MRLFTAVPITPRRLAPIVRSTMSFRSDNVMRLFTGLLAALLCHWLPGAVDDGSELLPNRYHGPPVNERVCLDEACTTIQSSSKPGG